MKLYWDSGRFVPRFDWNFKLDVYKEHDIVPLHSCWEHESDDKLSAGTSNELAYIEIVFLLDNVDTTHTTSIFIIQIDTPIILKYYNCRAGSKNFFRLPKFALSNRSKVIK